MFLSTLDWLVSFSNENQAVYARFFRISVEVHVKESTTASKLTQIDRIASAKRSAYILHKINFELNLLAYFYQSNKRQHLDSKTRHVHVSQSVHMFVSIQFTNTVVTGADSSLETPQFINNPGTLQHRTTSTHTHKTPDSTRTNSSPCCSTSESDPESLGWSNSSSVDSCWGKIRASSSRCESLDLSKGPSR